MAEVNKLDRVLQQVEAGVFVGDAITFALGGSIPRWAASRGFTRVDATLAIRCRRIPPSLDIVRALAEALGCSPDDVVQLLMKGAQQTFNSLRLQLSA